MFIAIPIHGRPTWRDPPWMTLLLILLNCLIYFGPQRSDEQAWEQAVAYYMRSTLPRLELPRYIEHLRHAASPARRALAKRLGDPPSASEEAFLLRLMERDRDFQEDLLAERVIRPDHADYVRWKNDRARFDGLKGSGFTDRWASNPTDWRPLTAVTAVFLHGSTAHLTGNMVFLFIFGCAVEAALGRLRYLMFYLLAGVGGYLLDLASHRDDLVTSLGASGAIAGLMAMYVALYGRRRIQFFVKFFVYFDIVRTPAIILLPIWIAHELLQQHFAQGAGVAYMAHAGGLLTGAMLIALLKWRYPETVLKLPDAGSADGFDSQRARAEALVRNMELDAARGAYRRLVALRPDDRESLTRFFNLAKLVPADEDFHQAAKCLLSLRDSDPGTDELVHDCFRVYWNRAKPGPCLPPGIVASLGLRFARAGWTDDAARLAGVLQQTVPTHDALPILLLTMVQSELRRNERERASEYAAILNDRFAGSSEARVAAGLLR